MKDKRNSTLIAIGLISFIWFIFDFFLKIKYFGEYRFLWFCSLGLVLISLGCLMKKPHFLVTFISIALIVQIQWMIDLIFHLVTGGYLTGNSAVVFESGQTVFDFVNSMRHLFMLPLALVAFHFLPSPNENKTKKVFVYWGTIVVLLSYLVTDKFVNLNCTRSSCLSNILNGNQYYPVISIIALLFVSYFIVFKLIARWKSKNKKSILVVAGVMFLVAIVVSIFSGVEYSKINHYSCEYRVNEFTKCEGIFFDYERKQDYAVLRVNDMPNSHCKISIHLEKMSITQEINISEKIEKIRVYLPEPMDNNKLRISSLCT